uniref:Terpene synthase N-terminal domain-containing protein n=1 Tax=Oryza punctata TaxID=4537 RepID=A0A0E0M6Y2_ORYPU
MASFSANMITSNNTLEVVMRQGRIRQMNTKNYLDDDDEEEDQPPEVVLPDMIDAIRYKLRSMGEGEISVSAYDTAWLALVSTNLQQDGGNIEPLYQSSLDWIIRNQHPDGSWGDDAFFFFHDRVISTLACVVALTTWNICSDKCKRGLSFIRENAWRLAQEEDDWMLIGFEITFPALLEMAKVMGLDIPYDEPSFQAIHAKRNIKLARIPTDAMHAVPTSLLYSIEGMTKTDLDWERLLQFRCSDGSFHSSPAATAYALMQTGNGKCREFLDGIVSKFNGGAPCVYPVDLFERLWVVDRLNRLGLSRHFTSEIKACLNYCYRHWTQKGLSHGRHCPVKDIDDTAMGFLLLRLHGYHVSTAVFEQFEKNGEFFCFPGQSSQSVTALYNTYRAAQLAFPGEVGLCQAHIFCRRFLRERQATNKLNDKWVIAKNLPREVDYALDLPWRASLPRIETRMYLEQYGASDDVWIGKVLYRMPLVCNELYLSAGKADFRDYQRLCRLELHGLSRWFAKNNLQKHGVTPRSALSAYFLAAANIFEPDRAPERLSWARTAVLADAIAASRHRRGAFTDDEDDSITSSKLLTDDMSKTSVDLCMQWKQWLMAYTADGYKHGSCQGDTALLLARTVEISSGRLSWTQKNLKCSDYSHLEQITSSICCKLATEVLDSRNVEEMENTAILDRQVDLEMQELTQRVLESSSNGVDSLTRQTFLHVVRSFYYVTHCSPDTIDGHISKVIFEDVI